MILIVQLYVNPPQIWIYIKNLRHETTGVAPRRSIESLVSESMAKATILNRQYQRVFTTENTSNIPDLGNSLYLHLPPLHITTRGVMKLLQGLQVNDHVVPRVLKELAVEIAPILIVICQKSIDQGALPGIWRKAKIFKKGDTAIAGNYHPVSLTCICSKLLEHIIVRCTLSHLEELNILHDCQHGFHS